MCVWDCSRYVYETLWTPDRATDIHPPGSVGLLFSSTFIPCSWQTSSSWIWVQMFPVPQGFRAESHPSVTVLQWRCTESSGPGLSESLESSFQSTFHYNRNLKSHEGFSDQSTKRDRWGVWTRSEGMVCRSERRNQTETVLLFIIRSARLRELQIWIAFLSCDAHDTCYARCPHCYAAYSYTYRHTFIIISTCLPACLCVLCNVKYALSVQPEAERICSSWFASHMFPTYVYSTPPNSLQEAWAPRLGSGGRQKKQVRHR